MLAKITIVCFAASYGVALLLEVSRLFFRLPVRLVVMLGFGVAGLIAHTLYLWNDAQNASGVPFSSFYTWFLMAAWLLAAAYVGLAAARPQSSIGIFMLPVLLALILAAQLSDKDPFPRDNAINAWFKIHGFSLLLGTVAGAFGFVAGLMYLVQSYRLKHKFLPRPGFRLPSLEWLQTVNKQTLYVSAILVAIGVFAGVVLNVIRRGIPWTDPLILSSGGLLAWLFAATLFELLYKPAQQGRKVAYLTIANFIFLAAVLWIVLFSNTPHATVNPAALPARPSPGVPSMKLQLVGCSHHTAPVEIREKLAFSPDQVRQALQSLRARYPETEAVLLSTAIAWSSTSPVKWRPPARRTTTSSASWRSSMG